VREALEQKKWKQAEDAAARVAHVLENEAGLISEAAGKLAGEVKGSRRAARVREKAIDAFV